MSTWAHKVQLRIQPQQGGKVDDTALNAIRLTCTDGTVLKSAEGPWGDWLQEKDIGASNWFTGASIRQEPKQGGGDDTGGNGLRFTLNSGHAHPGDGYWGGWSTYAMCPPGFRIAGLRTRVEQKVEGDNTALNDVQFLCRGIEGYQGKI